MTLVVDASVVVAALVDTGPDGVWAETMLLSGPLAAPHHLPVESAGVLRRAVLNGDLTQDAAALAHLDLLSLSIEFFPYEAIAARAWELRRNITSSEACYVALAEALQAPLATLDIRLSRAPGALCSFRTRKKR